MKKLLLIELNELNFDYVKMYLTKEKLNTFAYIINNNFIHTVAETEYENLEPWIQWASVHTGMEAKQHNIFRLGDMEYSNIEQIFEILNTEGIKVLSLSPMNAMNKLKDDSIFIPDPWTNTKSDASWWSKKLSGMLSETVNENSNNKISVKNILIILLGFLRFVRFKSYPSMFRLALNSIKHKWRRALFLDKFLHEINIFYLKSGNFKFCSIFFNSLAHIQHHYFFNSRYTDKLINNPEWYIKSSDDPLLESLKIFDGILADYFVQKEYEIILATGLSQTPYKKLVYYWRLKNHKDFLNRMNINYADIKPRMTRDFEITFDTREDLLNAKEKLSLIKEKKSGTEVFGEIDDRGNTLFVVLTFSEDLKNTTLMLNKKELLSDDHISFVGIKNGEHNSRGYLHFSEGIKEIIFDDGMHVSNIFYTIKNFFLEKKV